VVDHAGLGEAGALEECKQFWGAGKPAQHGVRHRQGLAGPKDKWAGGGGIDQGDYRTDRAVSHQMNRAVVKNGVQCEGHSSPEEDPAHS